MSSEALQHRQTAPERKIVFLETDSAAEEPAKRESISTVRSRMSHTIRSQCNGRSSRAHLPWCKLVSSKARRSDLAYDIADANNDESFVASFGVCNGLWNR